MSGRKISVDSELYERLKQYSEAGGYATPEEFAIHVLEREVDRLHGGTPEPAAEETVAPETTVEDSAAAAPVAEESVAPAPVAEESAPVEAGEAPASEVSPEIKFPE